MPFDKLKAPSKAEGLRVDTEQHLLSPFRNRGLARSNVSTILYNFMHRRGMEWPKARLRRDLFKQI